MQMRLTIARVRREDKWVEFWFTDNLTDKYALSCKFYQLEEHLEEHPLLEEYVLNRGYAGLISTWRYDKYNWELEKLEIPEFLSEPEYVRLQVDQVLSLEPEQAYLVGLIDVHQLKKMLDASEEKQ